MYDGNTESNEKMTKKGSSIIMKKAMTTSTIIAILSAIMLIVLAGPAIGAVNAADAADRQNTGYGTVDWSTATQGYRGLLRVIPNALPSPINNAVAANNFSPPERAEGKSE